MHNTERMRVILVDDNELTRAALRAILDRERVEVVAEAATGQGGLQACLRERPHLVFLDIMLPDANGLVLLDSIKDAIPRTDVIMISACNDGATLRRAMVGRADGYIIKPFRPATVEETMRKATMRLQRKRRAGESFA